MTRTDLNALILRDMGFSGISWTHYPWNPWLGCDKIAPECIHCYIDRDLRKQKNPDTGAQRNSWGEFWLSKTWHKPWKWQGQAEALNAAYRIFTCSHSDFFHAKADGFRFQAWETIRQTPNLCYLILTKRPERIASHLPADWGTGYQNVWLGVSTGCLMTLHKMDALRKIPAVLRFASYEPLLEDISQDINLDGYGWLITGGESGDGEEYLWNKKQWPADLRKAVNASASPGRRTMLLEWARKLQAQCVKAGIPFYFKQITAKRSGQREAALGRVCHEFPAAPFGLPWAPKGEAAQPTTHPKREEHEPTTRVIGAAKIIEVAPGYSVEYIERFYEKKEADDLLHALLAVDMTPEIIRLYGKTHETKRRSAQYGADYDYNPTAKKSQEWTPLMLSIRERMESVAGPLGGGLVQVYPDGEAGIGWHEDKGKPEVIASLSLGAEREFAFGLGPAAKCEEVWRMRLAHGSLLLIPAKTNEYLKHRLPPAKRVREPRVNVTLRRFPR
jgi:protein gp37/alkylated DNA repair dioxygenase AlkB